MARSVIHVLPLKSIIAALAACFLSNAFVMAGPATQKPNFLFLLVDELGWADVGYNGSTFYETPHIDRLARSGMIFTDAYAAGPVCSPTRNSIMTGKYPARTGHTNIGGAMLQYDLTVAEALKQGGYATFFAGKWHLGNAKGKTRGFKGNCAPKSFFRPLGCGLMRPSRASNLRSGHRIHQALEAGAHDVKIESKLRLE